jgi:hypothetical protein
MDFFEALGIVLIISIPIVIGVLLIVWIAQRLTGGRSLLYKFIQDYGYDHAYTLGALKNVVDKILTKEGYDAVNLSVGHEVGNRYVGDFRCQKDGYIHDITIITDGWSVDYRIDNEPTKTYK